MQRHGYSHLAEQCPSDHAGRFGVGAACRLGLFEGRRQFTNRLFDQSPRLPLLGLRLVTFSVHEGSIKASPKEVGLSTNFVFCVDACRPRNCGENDSQKTCLSTLCPRERGRIDIAMQ